MLKKIIQFLIIYFLIFSYSFAETIRKIEISGNKDYIVCSLSDNGPGIIDTKQAMIPYYTTKKLGNGLGLPIVTNIINEHAGNFMIKNKKKKSGAIISITLPKADA